MGRPVASDIRPDLIQGIAGGNLEVCKFDVVHDEPPDVPYDLIAVRALLHHLPERRAVVNKVARWLKARRSAFHPRTRLLSDVDRRAAVPKTFLGAIHSMGDEPSN